MNKENDAMCGYSIQLIFRLRLWVAKNTSPVTIFVELTWLVAINGFSSLARVWNESENLLFVSFCSQVIEFPGIRRWTGQSAFPRRVRTMTSSLRWITSSKRTRTEQESTLKSEWLKKCARKRMCTGWLRLIVELKLLCKSTLCFRHFSRRKLRKYLHFARQQQR